MAPGVTWVSASDGDATTTGALPDVRVVAFHVAHAAFAPPGFMPPPPRGVTIVVENVGNATAPDTLVELAVIRADGLRDVQAGFESFPLAPGERETFRTQWAPPPDKYGDYDLVATADPGNVLQELDEFNNAAHARAGNAPVVGVVYPARTVRDEAAPEPALALRPWARFAMDVHDAFNPAPFLLLDRSGNGRDAALPSGVPEDVAGRTAAARAFDGSAFVRAPNPESAAKSVTLWARPVDADAGGVLLASTAPSCERAALVLDAGRLAWHAPAPEPACATHLVASGPPVAPGAWAHVAVVSSGVTTTLFVDGAVALRVTHLDGKSGLDAAALLVGAALPGADTVPDRTLSGVHVDDVLVFDRALTPAEVAVLADRSPGPNA